MKARIYVMLLCAALAFAWACERKEEQPAPKAGTDQTQPSQGKAAQPGGQGGMGGSAGEALPPGSPRGTPPPDPTTGSYLPGSGGVQHYQQQEKHTGSVPPVPEPEKVPPGGASGQ